MSVAAFLAELRSRDIQVWADGDRLRCDAPAGVLPAELRDQLRQRKSDILRFLRSAELLCQQQRAIVPMQANGDRTPIFAVAGHNGDVFCYRALAQQLGGDQPFFGLQPPGLDGRSEPLTRVEDLAAYFAGQIRAFRPDGPYVIAGYCAGGTIAFELARQLLRAGVAIPFVALFASPFPTSYRLVPRLGQTLRRQALRVGTHAQALASRSWGERRLYLSDRMRQRRARREAIRGGAEADPVLILRARVEHATLAAVRRYIPGVLGGRVALALPSREWARSEGTVHWRAVARDVDEHFGPAGCDGANMLGAPYASSFARLFAEQRRD